MGVMPYIYSKIITKETTFDHYLLFMDEYYKLPRLYGTENITTEEVMYKLDIFQARFEKLDGLGMWYLEIIQTDAGTKFASKEFR